MSTNYPIAQNMKKLLGNVQAEYDPLSVLAVANARTLRVLTTGDANAHQ
jgi:hypothetical protein